MCVEKNRLLCRGSDIQTAKAVEMIPRPKGTAGSSSFSLIKEMKLDKQKPEEKTLYNDILVSDSVNSDFRHLQDVGYGPWTHIHWRTRF